MLLNDLLYELFDHIRFDANSQFFRDLRIDPASRFQV